jgi:hypothetical protein
LCDATGREIWRLETEVFPQRLSYRQDFEAMVIDLQNWMAGLAFAETGLSALPLGPNPGESAPHRWIDWVLDEGEALLRQVERIAAATDSRLRTHTRLRPRGQVRQLPPEVAAWLARHPQARAMDLLPDQYAVPSHDLPANRLVHQALWQVHQELGSLVQRQPPSSAEAAALTQLAQRVRRALRQPWLAALSPWQPASLDALLPHLGPAYRAFYRTWQRWQQSVRLDAKATLRLTPHDTPTLYEYWCLGYLIGFFQREPGYRLVQQNLLIRQAGRYGLRLSSGQASSVTFAHAESGSSVTLWYQREFSTAETGAMPQRPDLTLELTRPGQSVLRRYLMEVKYQLHQGHAGWGPPHDALAQVHRYRDAIVTDREDTVTGEWALRSMGGVVLFPYPGAAADFRGHPAYQSWATVGVGAVPAQPGQGVQPLLDAWLRGLIQPGERLQEPSMPYARREQAVARSRWQAKAWLLSLPSDEWTAARRAFMQQHGAWFVPWTGAMPQLTAVGIVMGASRRLLGVGEGLSMRAARASDLREMGTTWPHRAAQGQYLLVTWAKWTPTLLTLPADWPSQVNGLALDLAWQQGRPEVLWLEDYQALRRWQEVLALDAQAGLAVANEGLVMRFDWRGQGYQVRAALGGTGLTLWRAGQCCGDLLGSRSLYSYLDVEVA